MSTLPHLADPAFMAQLDWAHTLGELRPIPIEALTDPEKTLLEGLREPIGMHGPLSSCFHPGDTVAIVVPDASRKAAIHLVLPCLLDWLVAIGIAASDIFFFFALGVHRAATGVEQEQILGERVFAQYRDRCFNHDAHDSKGLVYKGCTSRGTEVFLNREACACDHLILTGSVVPHYFAGFGGGRKALVPGLAGAATIAQNHRLNLHPLEPRLNPDVRICKLDGNPVAEDLLEAARFHPPDFIINTVLTADAGIGGLFVGDMDAAHRSACSFAVSLFCVPIQERADLVIAAIPGAPNFIQSHKALVNAHAAVKPEGRIILLAPAPEGLGAAGFKRYLEMGSPETVIASLRQQADINGQTALSTLQKGPQTILVTEMPAADVQLLGAEKAPSLETALCLAKNFFRKKGPAAPACYLMPEAGITVPMT